ncbi:uncharacterized protein LOC143274907 [Babylonia areolata]|uniref:uncharacterized protein LOC143274907 n=1 Tax=Babylonia areolata TaxID=304850 RepID=UPI003FD37F58
MAVATVPMTKISLYFMLSLLRDDQSSSMPEPNRKHHWTYKGPEGPSDWANHYPHCAGPRQSPIDIQSEFCEFDSQLPDFELHRFEQPSTTLEVGTLLNFTNSGHGASVRVTGDMSVEGGGLAGRYRTAEFHFHWGSRSDIGSEHAVEGQKYPLEMHVVNYAEKYGTLKDAMEKEDGLAVLGVLFQISKQDNLAFEPLADALQYIHKLDEYKVVDGVRLRSLLPADTTRFYRYAGSLTTPRCFQSVTWTLFAEPQKISERQLERLRALLYPEDGHHSAHAQSSHTGSSSNSPSHMVDNWRPLQPLNGRVIRQSFPLTASGHRHQLQLPPHDLNLNQTTPEPTTTTTTNTTDRPLSPTTTTSSSSPVSTMTSQLSPVTSTTLPPTTTTTMTSSTTATSTSSQPERQRETTTTSAMEKSTITESIVAAPGGKKQGSVVDQSLVLLTSDKSGRPLSPPTFKSLTEVNDPSNDKVLISGANTMPGRGHGSDILQTIGGKDSFFDQRMRQQQQQQGKQKENDQKQQLPSTSSPQQQRTSSSSSPSTTSTPQQQQTSSSSSPSTTSTPQQQQTSSSSSPTTSTPQQQQTSSSSPSTTSTPQQQQTSSSSSPSTTSTPQQQQTSSSSPSTTSTPQQQQTSSSTSPPTTTSQQQQKMHQRQQEHQQPKEPQQRQQVTPPAPPPPPPPQQHQQPQKQQQLRDLEEQYQKLLFLLQENRRQQQLLQQRQQKGSRMLPVATDFPPMSSQRVTTTTTTTTTTTATTTTTTADPNDPSSLFKFPSMHRNPHTTTTTTTTPLPPEPRSGARPTTSSSSSPSRVRVKAVTLPGSGSREYVQRLARRLKEILMERQRKAASSTPRVGSVPRSSTHLPAASTTHTDLHSQYRQQQWQHSPHVRQQDHPHQQKALDEERMRELRRKQSMLEQQRLLLEDLHRPHGSVGGRALEARRTSTPGTSRISQSSTQSSSRTSQSGSTRQSAPRSVSQALQSLRDVLYTGPAATQGASGSQGNQITSGAASAHRMPSAGRQSPQGSRRIVPAAREEPFVFLHTYNRPVRIRKNFYETLYNRPAA